MQNCQNNKYINRIAITLVKKEGKNGYSDPHIYSFDSSDVPFFSTNSMFHWLIRLEHPLFFLGGLHKHALQE